MIPLTFLYFEYIDRPKLSEQKKTHLRISFLPPQVGSEQGFHLLPMFNGTIQTVPCLQSIFRTYHFLALHLRSVSDQVNQKAWDIHHFMEVLHIEQKI